ncbi:unnamed protein product [Sphagnum tenellum]
MRCYASMIEVYMISATLEHYTRMVDLLARAGHLQEAENIIEVMPCRPHVTVWMALLSACRIHGSMEMGEHIAKVVLELEPETAAVYVLLSNIYAATGSRHLCENVQRQRKEQGLKEQPGCTWIEVNNEVHTLLVDDQDHPCMIEIHAELKRLLGLLHDAGYVPYIKFVPHGVGEDKKLFHLCHHGEKLTVAFGLINTAPVWRAIVVRDANCFHHFEDGVCSCMDYW